MQFRWISLGTVILSAALVAACGGNAVDGSLSARSSSTMSKADSRYTSSGNHDNDDCDDSDHKSSDDSRSMSKSKSKSDDSDECKDDDSHMSSSSHSLSMASSSKDKDKDHGDDDDCKVTICHIPPGNHCAEHEIRIGKSAVPAHIAHGDYPGACDQPPPPPPPPACDPAACPAVPNGSPICNPDGT